MARKTNYRFEKLQREKRKAEKKAEKAKRKELGEGSSDDFLENDSQDLQVKMPQKDQS
tara:strand:- start:23 stop:196 length:174 start_codon:yes stop_codon:yes gene_type:complete